MLSSIPRARGVTIIELMIALAILALLLALGVPAFSTMMQNQKLRAGAESVLNGLQFARAEAVRLNVPVEFVLTDTEPTAFFVNSITASATGANWVVRSFDTSTGLYSFIEGKASSSGAGTTTAAAFNGGSTDTVTFNGFGTTSLGAQASIQITNPSGGACAADGGPMRCLNVLVSPGGQIKMCDPAVAATGDTRRC